jgi:hypothetical protein
MRPSPLGLLTAKGKLIHRTATMAFTEASIYDEAGRVCACATGTFKYVKRLPARAADGSRVVNSLNEPKPTMSPISTD